MNAEGRVGVHPQTYFLALAFVLRGLARKHVDPDSIGIGFVQLFSHDFHLEREVDI